MPKFSLLTPAKEGSEIRNTPTAELNKLIKKISSLKYEGRHSVEFKQLQSIATAIQATVNASSQKSQNKKNGKSSKIDSPSNSASSSTQQNSVPKEQHIMTLLGAALFSIKQVQIKNTDPVIGVNISNFSTPGGRLITAMQNLLAPFHLLDDNEDVQNKEMAAAFAKRTFYEWYQKSYTHILDGEEVKAQATCFSIDLDKGKEGSEQLKQRNEARQTAEYNLNQLAEHLPAIHEDQYGYLTSHKHLNESDYEPTQRPRSNMVVGAVDTTVATTVSIASTTVSTVFGALTYPLTMFSGGKKSNEEAKEEKSAVTVNTSALSATGK